MSAVKAKIIVANADKTGRANLARDLAALGYQVRATDDLSTVLDWVAQGAFSLLVLDVDLFDAKRNGFDVLQHITRNHPDCPVITLGGENTILSSLLSARFGAVDFFAKPFNFPLLAAAISSAISKPAPTPSKTTNLASMPLVGHSAAMQPVVRLISKAAQSNLPVLVRGEAGTGKFLVAQTIHKFALQTDGILLVLQASTALAEFTQLLDEAALPTGSTVILRHLQRFDAAAQSWLLDWLDRNEMNNHAVQVIATLPAFTSKEPQTSAPYQALLDRLAVLQINMPALRERREDIAELASQFLQQASNCQTSLASKGQTLLCNHFWPGNVRQLKNLINHVALLYNTPVLSAEQLSSALKKMQNTATSNSNFERAVATEMENAVPGAKGDLYHKMIAQLEAPLLRQVLRQSNQNQVKAAKILGINRNTLRKKMLELGLDEKK
ncbi:hypothetical protein MNBD_ALPHA06-1636 [hydrothermal vent metagenome]|uniref:Nitrogen regulation protein NR(I) n=1 Tax=hydrothermal vent metagenome TaxID=652676 RepID=A0A3B0T169_9ZZZZ